MPVVLVRHEGNEKCFCSEDGGTLTGARMAINLKYISSSYLAAREERPEVLDTESVIAEFFLLGYL